MSIRESLNRHANIVVGVTLAVIVILGLAYLFSRNDSNGQEIHVATQAYFTNDDGKTWFADDATKIPPFQKDGKEADLAYVYQCSDGKKFVAYLQRFTPEGKQQVQAERARLTTGQPQAPQPMNSSGVEIKSPGQSAWVNEYSPNAIPIMSPKCPDGGYPKIVRP